MSSDYWAALYADIPRKTVTLSKALPRPTSDMIDAFHRQTSFTLPTGYIEYIKVFGPGELAWKYNIKAPGYPLQGSAVDLNTFNTVTHANIDGSRVIAHFPEPAQARRLYYFCDTGGSGLIAWDPEDIQHQATNEYGIFVLRVGEASVVKIADSFQDFVEDVCLGEENLRIPGWDEDDLGPRRFFFPALDIPTSP